MSKLIKVKTSTIKYNIINRFGKKIGLSTYKLNKHELKINYGVNYFSYYLYPYYIKLEFENDKLNIILKNLNLDKYLEIYDISINKDIKPNILIKKIIKLVSEIHLLSKKEIYNRINYELTKEKIILNIIDEYNNDIIIIGYIKQ